MAILSGWKQIADYLQQGIRTVQRWEEIGLPVHRPRGTYRSAVVAFTEELDHWSHNTPILYGEEFRLLKAQVQSLTEEVASLKKQLKAKAASAK